MTDMTDHRSFFFKSDKYIDTISLNEWVLFEAFSFLLLS